jgi:hypothetical protein
MNCIILVLAAFACHVNSCLPPGITFNEFHNSTLFEEKMKGLDNGAAMGWAHNVGQDSPIEPWPAGDDGLVTIPYCFTSEGTKHFEYKGRKYETADIIKTAWHEWESRLNSGHTKHSKLNGFKELAKDGKSLLCRRGTGDSNWNPDVPEDTVEVQFQGNFGDAAATQGYTPNG